MPPILKTEALFDEGVAELLQEVEKHRKHLLKSMGELHIRRRKERVREELAEMVKNRLIQTMFHELTQTGEFEEAVEAIAEGKTDPYTACDNLILPKLGPSKG